MSQVIEETKSSEVERSRLAKFVDARLQEVSDRKHQRDIAREVGYASPNMISMIKQGHSKVALDRVIPLAKALECDPKVLMGLALEQFYPRVFVEKLIAVFSAPFTEKELSVIDAIREAGIGGDARITDEKRKEIIKILAK